MTNWLVSFNWITIATLGYLSMAVVAVFDKYLLHSRISKPAIYAFYVSVFSLFALGLVPFGFAYPGMKMIIYSFASGMFFIYGLLALYRSVQENEISRISPLVGTIIPLISVAYAYFFLDERLGNYGIAAVFLLVIGGFLLSFDLPIHSLKLFRGFKYAFLSATFQVISFGILKEVFNNIGFINGFIWNRIGFFLAGMSLFIVPVFKKQIMQTFRQKGKSKKRILSTWFLFVLNKVLAAIGSFLIVLAISKGSISAVNAVSSMQFVFVLIFVSVLSVWHHNIYQEKLKFNDWAQKILAVIIIGAGMWFLSMGDSNIFYLVS